MRTAEETKQLVQEKYGQIALTSSSCCSSSNNGSCCSSDDTSYSMIGDSYTDLEGYVAEADLGLGCGIPTEFAKLQRGETVLDLGAGAGNDVFVARSFVGETGHVIGVDMTPAMVERAKKNAASIKATGVEFRLGDIENLPVDTDTIDITISNCVLNLVPNKVKAFAEMYRVLKHGGRFCISDIVLTRPLPDAVRSAAELYVGCVGGALLKEEYLGIIKAAGFTNIAIKKEKLITIPPEVLAEHLEPAEVAAFDKAVVSITVVGYK